MRAVSEQGRSLLTSLQAGRAIACLLVVLYHNALYIFAKGKYWGYDPLHHLFAFGHAGVEFFFVLSGFIIMKVHWQDIGEPSCFVLFAKKRFIRIYPIYWLVLLFIVPVYFLVPAYGLALHRDPVNILSSLLLVFLKSGAENVSPVGWSLHHEILFYFLFSMAIFQKRFGIICIVLWQLASASFLFMPATPAPFLVSPLHLLFGMGMLACWLTHKYTVPAPALLAILGTLLFLVAGLEEDCAGTLTTDIRNLIYGAGGTLALMGLVALELKGKFTSPPFLHLIGDASYSIYLVHFTALSLLAKLLLHLPIIIAYPLLPVLAVGLGIAVHFLAERPLIRFFNRLLLPAR